MLSISPQELIQEVSSSSMTKAPLSPRSLALLEGVNESDPAAISIPLRNLLALEAQTSERCLSQMDEITEGSAGSDIFGNHTKNMGETLTCTNCGTQVTANRFAPHLEKCMLGKGRASARAARDMMRSSAENDARAF